MRLVGRGVASMRLGEGGATMDARSVVSARLVIRGVAFSRLQEGGTTPDTGSMYL